MTAVEGINPAGSGTQTTSGVHEPVPLPSSRPLAKSDSGSFSFGDFIDVINPLQHIPGVAELYRSITNDQISDGARKTGNMIYGFALGGPVGLGAMMAYSNFGDGRQSDPAAVPGSGPAEARKTADASTPLAEAGSGEPISPAGGSDSVDVPVPPLKPAKAKEDGSQKNAASPALMGQSVAAAREMPGVPLNLAELISGSSLSASTALEETSAAPAPGDSKASSVAYDPEEAEPAGEKPFLPDTQSLGSIASHDANRLPLDVLKALQVRHAQRTASERS